MSGIRSRTLIGTIVLLAVGALAALPVATIVLERQFKQYELANAENEAARVLDTLESKLESLRDTAASHASELASGNTQPSRETDTVQGIDAVNLSMRGLDFGFTASSALRIQSAVALPDYLPRSAPAGDGLVGMDRAVIAKLLENPRLQLLTRAPDAIGTMMQVDGRWYMLGVSSIPTASTDIPASRTGQGILGVGIELTPERIAALGKRTVTRFELLPALPQPDAGQTRLEDGRLLAVRVVRDTSDATTAGIRMDRSRTLQAQGDFTRKMLLAATLGALLLVTILWLLLVEFRLLRRLTRLLRHLQQLRAGQLEALPSVQRGDEIDLLAREINGLHGALASGQAQWQHEAQHDRLTGLGNRALLMHTLETRQAPVASTHVALLLLNLDGFKPINEVFGHANGDRLLMRVADGIRANLPKDASGFRLGGDEFAIVLFPQKPERALNLARELARLIPGYAKGDTLLTPLRVSIGVACIPLGKGRSAAAKELFQRADIALHEVKRDESNDVAMFDEALMASVQQVRDLERALRQAIVEERLQTWYQPIVAAEGHALLRMEALARWDDPELGRVEPSTFMAIAERAGLAPELDLLMLRNAVAALAEVQKLVPGAGVSINVSVQSLLDDTYMRNAIPICNRAGLPRGSVMLELTETVLSSNEAMLLAPLATLRGQGIRLQLDDFGVGYSSLGRLAQLDPAGIKLDGTFVRNRHTQEGENICRAIIGMARQLDMRITAEYVETPEDAEFLRAAGCDALQGYLFSKPLPLPELLDWIRERGSKSVAAGMGDSAITPD